MSVSCFRLRHDVLNWTKPQEKKMTKRRFLPVFTVVTLFGISGPVWSVETEKPVVPVSPVTDTRNIEELATQFSNDAGLSLEDAKASLVSNTPLLDLLAKHRTDPDFGAVWVTYKPFTVHLRTTRQTKDIEADFVKTLKRPVRVTTGGLSMKALDLVAVAANSKMKKQDSRYEAVPNYEKGKIVVRSKNAEFGRINSDVELESVEPVITPATTGYGGLAFWLNSTSGWVQQCTGGFMVRRTTAPFDTGILTAGHCYDYPSQYYNGETASAPELEMCGGSDQQVHPLSGTANNWIAMGGPLGVPAWMNVAGAGAGFYIGQVVHKRGRTTNGTFGTIVEYVYNAAVGSATVPNDCGGIFNLNTGVRVSMPGQAGDSGGPVVTFYNGQYLAMGITSGGNATGSTINPIWNVFFFQQWALCTSISC
jgi:hypothetical protein